MAVRRTAPVSERDLLASHPYLPGAERLVEEFAPSLRELFTDGAYRRARELGRARVQSAVDDPTGATGMEELAVATPEEKFLSFLFARLLLSVPASGGAIRRWAVAEAKRGSGLLERADVEELADVARRLGFEFEPDDSGVSLPVPDYIRLATPIRESDFRLVRQAVAAGRVRVPRERAARLLQEAVRLRLTLAIPLSDAVRDELRGGESGFLEEVVRRVPAPAARAGAAGPLAPAAFPPCIRKMRRMLEAGENLSHSGRFALAAFLHRAGASTETIVDAFRGAPDFDEGTTRYQVDHITRRDEGRGYDPPTCDTLRSHGLCFRDGDPSAPQLLDRQRDERCFDEKLRHPMQYYRWLGGRPVEVAPRGSPGAPRPPRP
ncbi:MAG TPA: hypothetical protein VFF67_02565 [Thermoplasmata archaeon]|nr:hypothetical protein [Thermoplasmata archaeon]